MCVCVETMFGVQETEVLLKYCGQSVSMDLLDQIAGCMMLAYACLQVYVHACLPSCCGLVHTTTLCEYIHGEKLEVIVEDVAMA